jgi:hypothetical protein
MVGAIQNPTVLNGVPGTGANRVTLFHEDVCVCCGLPLTHPISIYTAMGPVCLKRKEAELAGRNVVIAELFETVAAE